MGIRRQRKGTGKILPAGIEWKHSLLAPPGGGDWTREAGMGHPPA